MQILKLVRPLVLGRDLKHIEGDVNIEMVGTLGLMGDLIVGELAPVS